MFNDDDTTNNSNNNMDLPISRRNPLGLFRCGGGSPPPKSFGFAEIAGGGGAEWEQGPTVEGPHEDLQGGRLVSFEGVLFFFSGESLRRTFRRSLRNPFWGSQLFKGFLRNPWSKDWFLGVNFGMAI